MKKGIELVVFISGAVLMALEIAGGRLLSFQFGGGIFVWGSIIAVVLSGLSLGYYLGGKLADNKPSEYVLSSVILISGLLILAIPLLYPKLVSAIGNISSVYSPLMIVFTLFFIPSILLGCVSPFAMKLRVLNIDEVGRTSGNLYALATLGSVLGTFLAAFVLIFIFSINQTFVILSASLIGAVIVLKKDKLFFVVSVTLLILGSLIIFPEDTQIIEGNNVDVESQSLYGPIKAVDEFGFRRIYISNGVMGSINLSNPLAPVEGWEYLNDMIDLAVFIEAKDVLVLGVGVGKIPTILSQYHNMNVDAVDINNVVLEFAKKYFGMKPLPNLKTHTMDARVFLKSTDKKYDIVEFDIFKYLNNEYIVPPHLTTVEFFELLKGRLNEDGVLVIMLVKAGALFDSEYKTISSVFEYVYIREGDLLLIVASDTEIDFDERFEGKYINYTPSEDAIIYTDAYAPIPILPRGKNG